MSESNKAIIRSFIAIWNTGRFREFPSVMSADFVRTDIAGNVSRGLTIYGGDFGPPVDSPVRMRVEIEDMIAEDDKVAVRLHVTDLSGSTIRRTTDVFRIESGKIVEEWAGHD